MCIMYCAVSVICFLFTVSVFFVSFCHSQDMQVDALSSNVQCIQHFVFLNHWPPPYKYVLTTLDILWKKVPIFAEICALCVCVKVCEISTPKRKFSIPTALKKLVDNYEVHDKDMFIYTRQNLYVGTYVRVRMVFTVLISLQSSKQRTCIVYPWEHFL